MKRPPKRRPLLKLVLGGAVVGGVCVWISGRWVRTLAAGWLLRHRYRSGGRGFFAVGGGFFIHAGVLPSTSQSYDGLDSALTGGGCMKNLVTI